MHARRPSFHRRRAARRNTQPWSLGRSSFGNGRGPCLANEREAVRIPAGATDAAIADAGLRVVQAWAEQGDPQAIAVIRALTGTSAGTGASAGNYPGYRDGGVRTVTGQLVDPMQPTATGSLLNQDGLDMLKGRVPVMICHDVQPVGQLPADRTAPLIP